MLRAFQCTKTIAVGVAGRQLDVEAIVSVMLEIDKKYIPAYICLNLVMRLSDFFFAKSGGNNY